MRIVLFSLLLTSFLAGGCSLSNSGGDSSEIEDFPTNPLIRSIDVEPVGPAPALGDTVTLKVGFRFVKPGDKSFGVETVRKRLDSLYAKYGPLQVEGEFELHPYQDHRTSSEALEFVSGTRTFSKRMTPSDSARFRAAFKAVKTDTVMVGVKLSITHKNPTPESEDPDRVRILAGVEHECFIVREDEGIGLGDCWNTSPSDDE